MRCVHAHDDDMRALHYYFPLVCNAIILNDHNIIYNVKVFRFDVTQLCVSVQYNILYDIRLLAVAA